MDLHVAGRMEQNAVCLPIASTFTPPHDMVTMPSRELRDPVCAVWADAALIHPKRQQSPFSRKVAFHLHVKTCFKVRFPRGIKRVRLLADKRMPSDRHIRCSVEVDLVRFTALVFDLPTEAPVVGSLRREVLCLPPRRAFARVSPPNPPPQFLVDRVAHGVERLFAGPEGVVPCPSVDHGVEQEYQFPGVQRPVLLDNPSHLR